VQAADKLYDDFHQNCDFLFVYIMEAHACDEWPLGTRTVIAQHKTLPDRCNAANGFSKENPKWKLPMMIDTMDNNFHNAFAAWPERAFVIQSNIVKFITYPGDDGCAPIWPDQIRSFMNNTEQGR